MTPASHEMPERPRLDDSRAGLKIKKQENADGDRHEVPRPSHPRRRHIEP